MKEIFRHLRHHGLEAVMAPLLKCLEAIFELLVPLVVADIIDGAVIGGDRSVLTRGLLWLFFFATVGFGVAVLAQYFSAKAAIGVSRSLRRDLFERIGSFSYSQLDELGTATLISRMTSDIALVQNGVNLFLRLFLRSPFIVFGAVLMAWRLSTSGGVLIFTIVAILFLVVFLVMSVSIPLNKKVQSKSDAVLLKTRENVTGVKVVRAFGREEGEIEDFGKKYRVLYKLQLTAGRISALLNPLTYAVVNVGIIILIKIGSIKIDSGVMTTGELIALYNYMTQILVELLKFANLVVTLNKCLAGASRVSAVLKIEPEKVPGTLPAPETAPSVTFSNVSFTYRGASAPTLKSLNFSVGAGEIVGVIGGTGCGKTTLVNLLPRFYEAEGDLLLADVPLREYEPSSLRKRIGVVPQRAELFRGTVRDNLLFGDENASDEDLWLSLAAAQADGFMREKPGGLDTAVETGGGNFSGGQRQRLCVARALVRKPPLLILDDSASALDFATEAAMRKAILSLPYHPTVFLVSQRVSSVMSADRILVLSEGEAVGFGTHEDLVSSCEVYREICESQDIPLGEVNA